jgi:SAM-dependent methyltransferase
MGCGTGNQLVANQSDLGKGVWMVGLDLFLGMLHQAQAKTREIAWVQADASKPPFADQSFDFITNQFAFHHVQDKEVMLHAVYRLLRRGGRFVMTNISPWDMPDWLYYTYFPTAFAIDCCDFLPKEALVELMHQAGFHQITLALEALSYEQDLRKFFATVCRRDTCSQLLTISNAAYQAGLRQLAKEIEAAGHRTIRVHTQMYLLTLCGDKL